MIIILLFCLCIANKNYEVYGSIPYLSKNEDLQLEKHLEIINKPPIKTIHTEFGRIVDCIDINKQLAFDHPLLKNHKIQLKSSFQDAHTNVKTHDISGRYLKIGLDKDSCPEGTIPVQRTTKEDLIRSKRLSNNFGTLTQFDTGSHFAGLRFNISTTLFGIAGSISVYNPPIETGEMSSAYIWLSSGETDTPVNDHMYIHAGWQVFPGLSGDKKSHFFVEWTPDELYKFQFDDVLRFQNSIEGTGCTNSLCPGFVQTSTKIYIGSPFSNVSSVGGPQFSMLLYLAQDPNTKNWWLRAQDMDVGYFPATLFSNKLDHASKGGWTGQTQIFGDGPSPPMGSGHFAGANTLTSCYISNLYIKDSQRNDRAPHADEVHVYFDKPLCYDANYVDNLRDDLQRVVLFGGPGGFCGL